MTCLENQFPVGVALGLFSIFYNFGAYKKVSVTCEDMISISALFVDSGILMFVCIIFSFFILVYSARNLKSKKGNGKWMKISSYFKVNECSDELMY